MFTLEVEQDLKLSLIEPAFAAKYFEIVSREREYLGQWLAWPLHADGEAFFEGFVQKSLHDYADKKSLTCAMIFQGEVVGNISFNAIHHSLKKVEIGYWLSEEYQGNGIVSKSVARLIEMAFSELAMEKVQISAAVGNSASRKVCERLSFSLEGIITRAENLNGRIVDHAVYGLSRGAWDASKQS